MASSNLNGQPAVNFAAGRLDHNAQLQQMQMQMLAQVFFVYLKKY